jgi:hypothetical protein
MTDESGDNGVLVPPLHANLPPPPTVSQMLDRAADAPRPEAPKCETASRDTRVRLVDAAEVTDENGHSMRSGNDMTDESGDNGVLVPPLHANLPPSTEVRDCQSRYEGASR